MSMTQIAFLRKADIPTNGQIQDTIQKLGYDFKILGGHEKQIDQDRLECADFAAGACIGLISIALTDLSNALIYYMDDQMKYSKEMLLADTPQFLAELQKQNKRSENQQGTVKTMPTNTQTKNTFWDKLKNIFK